MHRVVGELSERDVAGAVGGVERRPVRVSVHAVPEAEVGSAGRGIVPHRVVRVRDPERGRRDVIVLWVE